MTEKQSSGELVVNGDFATGDLTGWMFWTDALTSVVPQEGRHIAVLKPTPYADKQHLGQLIDRERSDGEYVFGFWLRTSDANGNAMPGVTRMVNVMLWIHPFDGLGDGRVIIVPRVATSTWAKHAYRFWIEGRMHQQFELFFQNEQKRPPEAASVSHAVREGYKSMAFQREGPEPAIPQDKDDGSSPVALRDVTLFKA